MLRQRSARSWRSSCQPGLDAVGQLTQAGGQRPHRVRTELFFNSLEHQLTLKFVGQADGVVRVDHNSLHGLALLFSY